MQITEASSPETGIVVLRKVLIRLGLILSLIALGFFLAWAGQGDTLLIDNKGLNHDGVEYPGLGIVQITIDGEKPVEIARLERIKKIWPGPPITSGLKLWGEGELERWWKRNLPWAKTGSGFFPYPDFWEGWNIINGFRYLFPPHPWRPKPESR